MKQELRKTRVWQVIWGLKDGGAEVLTREYARLVDKEKFDVTIVTMYPFENTANYRRAKEANIEVVSIFKKRNILTRAVRLLFGRWYVPLVIRSMLKKDRPDAIHFNSQMAYCFTLLKRHLTGIQLLYSCHSEASKYISDQEEAAISELIQEYGFRFIALHEDMRKELNQRFGVKNTVVIRNGVDIESFRKTKICRQEKRRSIGVPEEAYVVGHVGRFSKEKNHVFLLKVFQELTSRKGNAHLLLIGSGELKDQITEEIRQRHLEDRVTILSHRTDIPELLRTMDVMIFPSLFEGLSVTLVEAQASGLKCVISDTINPANLLSANTIHVSLDADVKEWTDIALNDEMRNMEYGDIEEYDMNREIHRLERLYQGKQDV